jgi:hypothetical protein
MSTDVKVIHLDGEDFSVESDSASDTASIKSSKGRAEVVAASAVEGKDADSSSYSSSSSGGGSSDSDSECNTTDLLAADPLYFILSRLFMTPEGKNIATILEDINTKMDALLKK